MICNLFLEKSFKKKSLAYPKFQQSINIGHCENNIIYQYHYPP